MNKKLDKIKIQILRALEHPEAEEGLYLRNFAYVHEEDERPAVEGEQIAILEGLNQLVKEGKVVLEESAAEVVFHLARASRAVPQSSYS